MTRTRYRMFEDGHPYFMTRTIVGWRAVVTRPEAVQIMQKLETIQNNPVKRGYVDDPLHWRSSSARNYASKRDRWR